MSFRIRALALLSLLVACVASAQSPPAQQGKGAWLLLPDRVWTGEGDAAHAGWAVLVRDGAIAAVGPARSSMPATRNASPCPARPCCRG